MSELLADRSQPAKTVIRPAGHGRDEEKRLAFDRLLASHLEQSYVLAAVILGDESEAEDALQDAAEKAWRSLDQLLDADQIEAWFQRIVVNACRDRAPPPAAAAL